MQDFVGREAELARLTSLLPGPVDAEETKPGQAILVRGEPGVGKTSLVVEFVRRAGVPSVLFSVPVAPIGEQLDAFSRAVADSNLPGAAMFREVQVTSWDAALRLLAEALPQTEPSIVVFDGLLAMIDSDPGCLEGTLAKIWDRELSNRPVLFCLVGSDVARLRALNAYDRPFFMRATEMLVTAPADQAWFWTDERQAREREVDEHIAQGEVTTHGSTEDFLTHLANLDEEGT